MTMKYSQISSEGKNKNDKNAKNPTEASVERSECIIQYKKWLHAVHLAAYLNCYVFYASCFGCSEYPEVSIDSEHHT